MKEFYNCGVNEYENFSCNYCFVFFVNINLLQSNERLAEKTPVRPLAFELPTFNSKPLDIGSRRELFIDNYLIGALRGAATRHLFEMVPATTKASDVAMTCDADWEGPWCRYAKFIQDKDSIKVWYMGHHTYDYRNKDGEKVPVACSPKIEPSVMRVPGACRVYDSHEKKKTYPRTDR